MMYRPILVQTADSTNRLNLITSCVLKAGLIDLSSSEIVVFMIMPSPQRLCPTACTSLFFKFVARSLQACYLFFLEKLIFKSLSNCNMEG